MTAPRSVEGEDGIRVWCCHYPMVSWPDKNRSTPALHAYGHVHAAFAGAAPVTDTEKWRAVDVGVDACAGYAPRSARELKAETDLWARIRAGALVPVAE